MSDIEVSEIFKKLGTKNDIINFSVNKAIK